MSRGGDSVAKKGQGVVGRGHEDEEEDNEVRIRKMVPLPLPPRSEATAANFTRFGDV